jgi:hypothetical protein
LNQKDNKISSLFISDLTGSESSGKEIKRKKRNGKGDDVKKDVERKVSN